jgi:hypothetical protein
MYYGGMDVEGIDEENMIRIVGEIYTKYTLFNSNDYVFGDLFCVGYKGPCVECEYVSSYCLIKAVDYDKLTP